MKRIFYTLKKEKLFLAVLLFSLFLKVYTIFAECSSGIPTNLYNSDLNLLTVSDDLLNNRYNYNYVGSTIDINWSSKNNLNLPKNQYNLIVFSMPNNIRLKGSGFLIFPPGENLPFGSNYDHDLLRIVYPLYLIDNEHIERIFGIKFLAAGSFKIKWNYLITNDCGDILFSLSENINHKEKTIEIYDRKPIIILQDKLGMGKPNKVLLSHSREYKMCVFNNRFHVINAITDDFLFEKTGRSPNFSPTSRYISYSPTKPDGSKALFSSIEVIDLLDQKVIYSSDVFQVVAWANNDSFLVVGNWSWGYIEVVFPLFDENISLKEWFGGRGSSAWEDTQIAIDVENALCRLRNETNLLYNLLKIEQKPIEVKDENYSQILKSLNVPVNRNPPKRWEFKNGFKVSNFNEQSRPRGVHKFFCHSLKHEEIESAPVFFKIDQKPTTKRGQKISRAIGLRWSNKNNKFNNNIALTNRLTDIGVDTNKNIPFKDELNWFKTNRLDNFCWEDNCKKQMNSTIEEMKRRYPKFRDKLTYEKMRRILNEFNSMGRNDNYPESIRSLYWNYNNIETLIIHVECDEFVGAAGHTEYNGYLMILTIANNKYHELVLNRIVSEDDFKFNGYKSNEFYIELELQAFYSENHLLTLSNSNSSSIIVYDLQKNIIKNKLLKIDNIKNLDSICLSDDNRLMIQVNKGGNLFLYDLISQFKCLKGLYIDDEIVLYSDDGFYNGTFEGIRFVTWFYPGMKQHFDFSQYESRYYRPDIIQKIIDGQPFQTPKVELSPPPTIEMLIKHKGQCSQKINIDLNASSYLSLSNIKLFINGTPSMQINVSGKKAQKEVTLDLLQGKQWITAVAYNTEGFSSIPQSLMIENICSTKIKMNKLYMLGIGIDNYPNMCQNNIYYSKRDIEMIMKSIEDMETELYQEIQTKHLFDEIATSQNIVNALKDISNIITNNDTLLLYFAGHGIRGKNNKFYFVTSNSTFEDIEEKGLAWDKVSLMLKPIKAKVIVFLDACHSGIAAKEKVVPNDKHASELMKAMKSGLAVIAASKGRQYSLESTKWGGGHGIFSYTINQILTTKKTEADLNHNGIIELSELFKNIKYNVLKETNGKQSPWFSTNTIVGEMPIF